MEQILPKATLSSMKITSTIDRLNHLVQISLFSVLNNLANISFLPEYAAICGITEQEIAENFKPELARMAEVNGWTLQETHDKLKNYCKPIFGTLQSGQAKSDWTCCRTG